MSSKAFSVYGEEPDTYIIKESDMPPWMNLDTLYIFTFDSDKDDSEFKECFAGNELTVIEPIQSGGDLKGNYNLLIETKHKFNFFGVKFCKELNRWLAAVKKAKSTVEEIARTKSNHLYKNIDPIIYLYKQKVASLDKQTDEVLKRCKKELTSCIEEVNISTTPVSEFIKASRKAQENFIQTLDALQASRPFYSDLFKILLKNYHTELTSFLQQYWNQRMKEFDVVFCKVGNKYS